MFLPDLFNTLNKGLQEWIPADIKKWPEDWYTTWTKSYPRFPTTQLGTPAHINVTLDTALQERKSSRHFVKSGVTGQDMSTILYWSAGVKERGEVGIHGGIKTDAHHRMYPSSGGLFTVEVYVVIQAETDLESGIYHYNSIDHSLEKLFGLTELQALQGCYQQKSLSEASAVFFTSAVFSRGTRKYLDAAYNLSLIEVGHVCQNISLVTTALHRSHCLFYSIDHQKIKEILDLDRDEVMVVALAID